MDFTTAISKLREKLSILMYNNKDDNLDDLIKE
jgi:hypothetical protein